MLASRFLSHKEAQKTQKDKTFVLFVANFLRLHFRSGRHVDLAALPGAGTLEVHQAVDGPNRADG